MYRGLPLLFPYVSPLEAPPPRGFPPEDLSSGTSRAFSIFARWERGALSEKRIYAVGDSLTWGYPYGPDYSWVLIVEKELGIPTVNLGINGDTTKGMSLRLAKILTRVNKDSILVITGGANDAFQFESPRIFMENYINMIDLVKKFGCIPVIGLTSSINEGPFQSRLEDYRRLLLGYTQECGLTVIDFYEALGGPDGKSMHYDYGTDSCHPNREGYRKMGDAAVCVLGQSITG